jgi:hypothetical protein
MADDRLIETMDGGVIILQRSATGEVLVTIFDKTHEKTLQFGLDNQNAKNFRSRMASVLVTKVKDVCIPYLLGEKTSSLTLQPPITLGFKDEEGRACILITQ